VKKLRGVRFDWKDSKRASVGLIAEEVEDVVPEVVSRDGKTLTGLNYDSLIGVLVEAIKEQEVKHQAELREQRQLIQEQQNTIEALQEQQRIDAALARKVSDLERILLMSHTVSKAY